MAPSASNLPSSTRRPYFGWWLVVSGFLIMGTCYTTMVSGMSLFQPHIVEDLGITVGTYNMANSMSTLVSIIGSLVIGNVVDRVDGRILGGLSVAITAAALIGFAYVGAAWQLFLLFAIDGLVIVAGTRLLISIVLTNWFTLKQGLAVAVALSGSGFGGAIFSPAVSSLIAAVGWRASFMVLAAVCFIIAFPITVAVFYSRPADKGLEPYGAAEAVGAAAASEKHAGDVPVDVEVPWAHVWRHPSFWLMVAGFMVMGVINGAAIPNSITNMTSVTVEGQKIVTGGHDMVYASSIYSFNMIVVLVSKIATGWMYDRFGVRTGIIVGSAACLIGSVGLCFAGTMWGPVVSAVFFGFGTCMGTVAPSLVAVRCYGAKDVGRITGWLTSLEMLGYAFGTMLSGSLFDAFHSFVPMWMINIAGSVLMLVLLLAAAPAARALVDKIRHEARAA
ncbi:transporter major facilitator family protein [Collinsella sp. CAG:398]|mgnify:FL=1|nr:transporter major facilitator family protein [Collinsella sp. CAG:398]